MAQYNSNGATSMAIAHSTVSLKAIAHSTVSLTMTSRTRFEDNNNFRYGLCLLIVQFPFGLSLSIVIRTLNGNGNSPLDSSLTMTSRTRFDNNNFPFGLCLSIVP